MASQIGRAIPGSFTVIDEKHPFYEVDADLVIAPHSSRIRKIRQWFFRPAVLGWALARARGVVYVGPEGFLDHTTDEREWEIRFIRGRGKHAVLVFTGSDIRSPALMTAFAEEQGVENIGSIQAQEGGLFTTSHYELVRQRRARVADECASAVFTARVDQLSYLTGPTHAFPYLYPDSKFHEDFSRYEAPERIVVVHAPSKPVIKGTEFVRAAMAEICLEYPAVEYRELIGVSNDEVIASLQDAHVALNQFHAYMPGVFGLEAMANGCVMETDLADAEGAWVVARPDTLTQTLRTVLAAPEGLRAQAERGYAWTLGHASASATGERLMRILDGLDKDAASSR